MNRSIPDLQKEASYWARGCLTAVGVDEVGRGSLAGPVVAAAVGFPPDHSPIEGVRDSKQLSLQEREALAPLIRMSAAYVGIGEVDAGVIDTEGIVPAVSLAMKRAVNGITNPDVILVDGPSPLNMNTLCDLTECVVRGDQLVYSIAAASIIAKVYRDQLMTKLAHFYPGYEWEANKGYGTSRHVAGIDTHGLSPFHRRTFIHTV